MKLTDLAIKSLAVDSGRRTFFDDTLKGFGIRVTPISKTFVLVIHRGNRNEWETIGKYPIVSLGKAREAARDRLAAIQLKQEHVGPTLTFEEAFTLFKQTHTAKKNRPSTSKETERIIRKHFMPKLGRRDLGDISTHDVAQLIDKLLPTPGTCFHAYASARLMFRWAARRRLIDRSPLDGLPAPVEIVPRERTLTDDELVRVLRLARADDTSFRKIVQLLILTGQRRGQIAQFRREFIVENQQIITWPAETMKGDRRHSIPLTTMAMAVLSTLPKTGYLFPARGRETPFNGFSKSKPSFDKKLEGMEPWTLHDLRRTFSTGLASLGVAPHIHRAHPGSSGRDNFWRCRDLQPSPLPTRDARGIGEVGSTSLGNDATRIALKNSMPHGSTLLFEAGDNAL